jgi:hypothetical protein
LNSFSTSVGINKNFSKLECNDNGKKCEILENLQGTLDVLKDAVRTGKVIKAKEFAKVPYDQKQLGQFQYLLLLLPVIKCFDLTGCWEAS